MIYRFDDFEIDTECFELRRGGIAEKIEPQVFALIVLLVSNRGRLVTKDELNLEIWGGRVVSDAVVNSRIRTARKVLGDDGKAQRLIKTVHGRGFRFVGEARAERELSHGFYDLRSSDHGSGPAQPEQRGRPSIAVLPFRTLGLDQRHEPLADAIAHEVIVELARLHWLFVIARGSSFRFRGPDVDMPAAGALLGARYLLTGAIAIEGRRAAVTVELVEAEAGRVLWADRFDGALEDLLALRLTIAAKVASTIEVRISAHEVERTASIPTENLDSWTAYHRGLRHMFRFNPHDNTIAARLFDRALVADPGFARAHAGLSFTHFQNAFVGFARDADRHRTLAREHAEKGMELDPLDPFANLTMGRAEMLDGDIEGASVWFDRATGLCPNYAFSVYNRALTDAIVGAGANSEAGAMKAMALSPVDPLHYAMLTTRALSHIVRGEYADAVTWAERGGKAPNAHAHIFLIAALAHELSGKHDAALRWVREIARRDSGYDVATFHRSFPFRDARTAAVITDALKRLGV